MKVPGFTAKAALDETNTHYDVLRGAGASAPNAVQPAQGAISFIDPNCGSCTCHVYEKGLARFIVCTRACTKLAYVNPRGEGVYFYYTRSCSPPWGG
jgi:hypothetical protein